MFEEKFICPSCQNKLKEYVWSNREKNPECINCNVEYFVDNIRIEETFTIIKHKKGRSKKEAIKRSQDHFKKEIMPTLAKQDQRYFEKKYGKK